MQELNQFRSDPGHFNQFDASDLMEIYNRKKFERPENLTEEQIVDKTTNILRVAPPEFLKTVSQKLSIPNQGLTAFVDPEKEMKYDKMLKRKLM